MKLYRMWINQPSTLQKHHKYHGMNVLAQEIDEDYYQIWFTEGNIISMEIEGLALSEGWNTQRSKYKTITWKLAQELIHEEQLIIPANPEYTYESPRLKAIIEELDKIEYRRYDLHAEIANNAYANK